MRPCSWWTASPALKSQTEKVFEYAAEFNLGAAFLVNKLDRERASFDRSLASINEFFGRTAVPLQLPIGSEKNFTGIVDLVTMKSYTYTPDGDGKGKEGDIPGDLADAAKSGHEALVEMVAEGNDALMEEFFEQGTLPVEHIVEGLQLAIRERRIFPVLCASSYQNIATDRILSFIVEYLPSPDARGKVKATLNGNEMERPVAEKEPAAAVVFKTMADPFAGRVSFFKVESGVIKNDDHLNNSRTGGDERLAHLSSPMGKNLQPVTELHAGDIGAVAKLNDTLTGDTLHVKTSPIVYPKVVVPEPSIAYAIEAKTRNDEDRMGNALAQDS